VPGAPKINATSWRAGPPQRSPNGGPRARLTRRNWPLGQQISHPFLLAPRTPHNRAKHMTLEICIRLISNWAQVGPVRKKTLYIKYQVFNVIYVSNIYQVHMTYPLADQICADPQWKSVLTNPQTLKFLPIVIGPNCLVQYLGHCSKKRACPHHACIF